MTVVMMMTEMMEILVIASLQLCPGRFSVVPGDRKGSGLLCHPSSLPSRQETWSSCSMPQC